ncbi:hypothetical protein Tco_1203976 [Tanacetum coccineum]
MCSNHHVLTDKKEFDFNHEVEIVIYHMIMPFLGTKGLASPNANDFGKDFTDPLIADNLLKIVGVFQFTNDTMIRALTGYKFTRELAVVPKSVAGSRFPAASSTYLYEDIHICAEVSCVQDKTQADWMLPSKFIFQSSMYIVPAGKVILIVSTGRLSLVPTGRVLSPGRVK